MSVKDRTVDGPADHVRIVLTACWEYEVVETGKPSTALLRKYRTSSPPLRASRVVAEKRDAQVYFWWSHVELD